MTLSALGTPTTFAFEEFVISSTTVVTPFFLVEHSFPFRHCFNFRAVTAVVFVRLTKETTYLL